MRLRLFRRERTGLNLLSQMAEQIVLAAQELAEILGAPAPDFDRLATQMHRHEAESTALHFAVLTQMRTSFINPLPREDIYALSRYLNEACERLDGAAELVALYKLTRLPARAGEQLQVIGRQAELTADAVRRLDSLHELEDYWLDVLRLSKRAERTHRAYIAELVADRQPEAYTKHRDVADQLVETTRDMRRVAVQIGAILVKES